jgi:hypothetical protein
MKTEDQLPATPSSLDAPSRPQWHKPVATVLDVERGTLTTSGPVADGNGSTS